MSLAKHFNFKPKEYAAPSHGVRSKKIIRTWASQMKAVKQAKASQAEKKGAPKAPAAQPAA